MPKHVPLPPAPPNAPRRAPRRAPQNRPNNTDTLQLRHRTPPDKTNYPPTHYPRALYKCNLGTEHRHARVFAMLTPSPHAGLCALAGRGNRRTSAKR
eukprot:8295837-Lingulodinium_polyedra.AAC.1